MGVNIYLEKLPLDIEVSIAEIDLDSVIDEICKIKEQQEVQTRDTDGQDSQSNIGTGEFMRLDLAEIRKQQNKCIHCGRLLRYKRVKHGWSGRSTPTCPRHCKQ